MLLHSARKRSRAVIIKACAIDQSLVFTKSKQSRSWVSQLRMIGNCPRLDKTETERSERLQCNTIFIQACCQADRIRKRQTKSLNRQRRVTVRLRE